MERKDLFLQTNGERLHVAVWYPDGEVRAVLQIAHGMQEYIGRYAEFAGFMAGQGIAVVGHDHPGHGETAEGKQLGFFAEKDGDQLVLSCMAAVTAYAQKTFPGKPLFLLGHSMGSFFARYYLTRRGDVLKGAIIMGTGQQPKAAITAVCKLAEAICAAKGPRHCSKFIANAANGGFNKKFEAEGKNAWLSHNEESVAAYNQDPFCQYMFSAGAYRDMFHVIKKLSFEEDMDRIPKDLPVLFVSGADDPVGDFGKGPRIAADAMRKYVNSVQLKLYDGMRHEILNEPDRLMVYDDLLEFIEKHI